MEKKTELLARAELACQSAQQYAYHIFNDGDHWCGELLSNATITAEQVFFYQSIGQNPIPDADAYRTYLLNTQQADGSWVLAPYESGDISTSCEAYLALKILGVDPESRQMRQAREFILQSGGVAKVRIFTRIYFAQFGLFPWEAVPELPAEFILLPSNTIMNVYKLSSWARSTVIPLLIISHHRPVYKLPNGRRVNNTYLDEIWVDPTQKLVPYGPSLWSPWESDLFSLFFGLLDAGLHWLRGLRRLPFRKYARKRCVEWILSRQEKQGDWAGIIPPMHSGIQALLLEGYTTSDDVVTRGIEAIERFTWQDEHGKRLQSCVSPVWDTVLMIRAICDVGGNKDDCLRKAVTWVRRRQNLGSEGDWRIYNPHLPSGGFSFEYYNAWYPDVDDTAAAILALLNQDVDCIDTATIARAAKWICGMQNLDGGWGAFDVENDKQWLNKIPFSDMNALCDPSTADVTGHVLEAFGLMLQMQSDKKVVDLHLWDEISRACHCGIEYLAREQEPTGAWYGRWGVNYLYGTSNVLCGLEYFAENDEQVQDMISSGASWLRFVQNADGGWGEGVDTYRRPSLAGRGSSSTPSQTAWALMGLLAAGDRNEKEVIDGVEWLLANQTDVLLRADHSGQRGASSWPEDRYTGTGFPNHFYLGYTLYRHYFPMMALGRYRDKIKCIP